MTRPGLTTRWLRAAAFILIAAVALAAASCGSQTAPEIGGFWSFRWGAPYDSVLTDTADIRFRLGGDQFRVEYDPIRVTFRDVQYGMGYDQVVLDFTPDGKLWHGMARTHTGPGGNVDSVLASIHDRYGRDTGTRRIQGDSGYITYWFTRSWIDRDFYSATITPQIEPEAVKKIDLLYDGCLADCPTYSIRLLPSGDAYLWSMRGKEQLGGFRGTIGRDQFMTFAKEAVGKDYMSLANLYEYDEPNLPSTGIRVDYGHFERISESLARCGPPALEDFVAQLDSATAGIAWTQIVSWDTIRLYDQHLVNLDSLEKIGESAAH